LGVAGDGLAGDGRRGRADGDRGRGGVAAGGQVGDVIGLDLGAVAGLAHLQLVLGGGAGRSLLDGVGQLVGDQVIALGGVGPVLVLAEVDVPAHGVGPRADGGGRLLRGGAGVELDPAQVGA